MSDLTFKRFSEVNYARCRRWHNNNLDDWSVDSWGCALGGEVGEILNAIKKLRRLESGYASKNEAGRQIDSRKKSRCRDWERDSGFVLLSGFTCKAVGVKFRGRSDQKV